LVALASRSSWPSGEPRPASSAHSNVALSGADWKSVNKKRNNVPTGPDIVGAILDRKLLTRLVPLNRYGQRAFARRRFAIQEFDSVGRNERRQTKNKVDFLGNKTNG
jgi:hypothetical protein